ncbi:MAG: 5-formyltetrahydrofolate cyclo-ligase [Steroidobacteraceae bacterium]
MRQQLRQIRCALPRNAQRKAATAVARRLGRHPLFKPGARIGVYLALPGELNLQDFIRMAWGRHCQLFVPHITSVRRKQMMFYRYAPAHALQANHWGIPQLRNPQQRMPAIMLDVVLVPTVGFDRHGHRLGMGAGFYDRHFAHLRRLRHWRRPRLIGAAYACQEVPALAARAHDVRLDMIVTERAMIRPR